MAEVERISPVAAAALGITRCCCGCLVTDHLTLDRSAPCKACKCRNLKRRVRKDDSKMSWPGNDAEMEIENELTALRAVDKAARELLLELDQRTPPTPECGEWMTKIRAALAAVPEAST